MSANASIDGQVLELSKSERIRLAELIYSSLDLPDQPEIDAAWAKEVEDRVTAYERGEIDASDAEDVFARMRRNFEK